MGENVLAHQADGQRSFLLREGLSGVLLILIRRLALSRDS